jgi:predicted amino acid-binding ACT domain protein
MTTATDTDLQQVKDLITAGNAATQKQIADLALSTQKQIADLTLEMKVGFAKLEGDIKNLDTKFEEKTKNLDLRITSREFTVRTITVGLIGGLLLAFSKFLFFGKV